MSATPTAPQTQQNVRPATPAAADTPPAPASAPAVDAATAAAPLTQFETAPTFRVAFRGYDVREVDRWAKVMEAEARERTKRRTG